MDLFDFRDAVENYYQATNTGEDDPMVLTLVNPDGTLTAVAIDGASLLNTGNPDGTGSRVHNLIVFPVK